MNISRRQLYAAGEPLGDSATRSEGTRTVFGGGGGGQSGVYYKNQDKLLGVQADIASNMYDQYAAYAPQYMANSMAMVNEANTGALAERMRGRAAADSASAASMERDATTRQLQSMGVNPADPRFAGGLRTAELGNAANRANAMNNAGWAAEDQKWNRNANAYGQIAGMGAGAMQGLSSAAGGYGQMAGQMQSANNAAMAGYGQFGAALGQGLMKKADGGYINEPGYAEGGNVNPIAMPRLGNWRDQATGGTYGEGPSTMDAAMAIATPAIGMKAAELAGQGIKDGAGAGLQAFQNSSFMTQAPAPVADAVGKTVAAKVGEAGAAEAGKQVATKAAADATTSALTNAATNTAGSALNSATGGLLPEAIGLSGTGLAAAGGLGALAYLAHKNSWFADGGQVGERENFQPGGPVQGPGGPTEDAIPAWLSNGEHVQNATSTQLAGVDVLDQINQIGLMVREGRLDPDRAVQMIGELMKSRGEEMAEGHPGVKDSPAEERAEMKKTAAQRKAQPSKAKNFKSTKPMKPAKMDLKEGKR